MGSKPGASNVEKIVSTAVVSDGDNLTPSPSFEKCIPRTFLNVKLHLFFGTRRPARATTKNPGLDEDYKPLILLIVGIAGPRSHIKTKLTGIRLRFESKCVLSWGLAEM